MKKECKRIAAILLTALLIVAMLPTNAFAASKKPTPGKVTLTKISAPAYNKISISWKRTTNATNYVVYYKKAGASKWTKLTTVASNKTSYTHTSSKKHPIVVGQKYTYTVRAYNKTSKKYSSYNTKGLTTRTLPATVKLKKAALNSQKTAVTVSWNKAAGCNYYVVYRKSASKPSWKKLTTVKSSVLSYTDKNPVKGEKNTYTVRAYYSKTKVLGSYNKTGVSATMPAVKVTKVALNKTSATLTAKGQTEQLKASVTPSNATNKTVTWTSSNTKVATVSGGKVTAVANGTATITATAADGSSKKATCKITVKIPVATPTPTPVVKVTSVSLNKTSATLTAKDQTIALTATVSPSNAANKSVTWKSSNSNIATVSNGTVTAVANGTATITATAADGSGKSASCSVTVSIPTPVVKVTGVTLNKTSATLTAKGQTVALTATVSPSNAANKSVTWKTSNANVATVSNGTVTAVANGTATITATAADGSGKSASCNVTVNIPTVTPTPTPAPTTAVENVSLAGGETKICSFGPRDVDASVNLEAITFELSGNITCIEVNGDDYDLKTPLKPRQFGITALKTGTIQVVGKYNGTVLKTWNITVTSNWDLYMNYTTWKKDVEAEIWNDSMTIVQKLDALKNYIQSNFTYSTQSSIRYYSYQTRKIDCFGASDLFGDMAKDLGVKVGYVDSPTGTVYEYLADATANSHGHMNNAVWLDGKWVGYDAQPLH